MDPCEKSRDSEGEADADVDDAEIDAAGAGLKLIEKEHQVDEQGGGPEAEHEGVVHLAPILGFIFPMPVPHNVAFPVVNEVPDIRSFHGDESAVGFLTVKECELNVLAVPFGAI